MFGFVRVEGTIHLFGCSRVEIQSLLKNGDTFYEIL